MQFVNSIYNEIHSFPESEKYAIISQITRASISIASNIAEGTSRTSEKDFNRFIEMSIGSSFEVETLLEILRMRNYLTEEKYNELITALNIIQKQLNALHSKLTSKH
ncbi:MAG: four helix bundle protein [Bacteroidetes bacterium]|nr:four helix bundle protein [Bacteroidota bacterium]